MNKYVEVKTLLKGEDVVRRYLGNPIKSTGKGIWYKSPFRQERTASFYVSDKGIHDFGSSEHYDIVSFVARYFNTDSFGALKILCSDFCLNLLDEKLDYKTIKKIKKQRQQERQNRERQEREFNTKMQKLCDEIIENEKLIKIFSKTAYLETLKILYDKEVLLELEFEELNKR